MDVSFDGAIAGLGTASGTRLVVGIWPRSPFGPIADAMIARADGERLLIAPTSEVADFIAATYTFDTVRTEPVTLHPAESEWTFESRSLAVTFRTGARTGLGRLLTAVPRPLARSRAWCRAIDPVAGRIRPGVRTAGTAGADRREYYSALDEHRVVAVRARLDGVDLGDLRPVEPAVRFGFGSAPARPAIVRVTTRIVA